MDGLGERVLNARDDWREGRFSEVRDDHTNRRAAARPPAPRDRVGNIPEGAVGRKP